LRIRELELLVAQNQRLPQLDFRALYRLNGVGENLSDTLAQMTSTEYSDWLVGMTFSVPLGRRLGTANTRAAELQLARAHGLFEQRLLSLRHAIGDDLRQIDFTRLQYDQARDQAAAAEDWMQGAKLRYENPHAGGAAGQNWLLQTLNEYLFALRFRTEAVSNAALLLAQYNNALVQLEETKGTLLATLDIDLFHDPCRQARQFAPERDVTPIAATPPQNRVMGYSDAALADQRLPVAVPANLPPNIPSVVPMTSQLPPPITSRPVPSPASATRFGSLQRLTPPPESTDPNRPNRFEGISRILSDLPEANGRVDDDASRFGMGVSSLVLPRTSPPPATSRLSRLPGMSDAPHRPNRDRRGPAEFHSPSTLSAQP